MQVIEAQCSRFWRLTITSISNRCAHSRGKVAMDTYAGRSAAQRSNLWDRATAGEGLTAAHLPAEVLGVVLKRRLYEALASSVATF
jgi:hypothetical protein